MAAVAWRSDIMSALSGGRILHDGTQNANPLLLAVVRRSLDHLTADDNLAFARMEQLAERLVNGLEDAIGRAGIPALSRSPDLCCRSTSCEVSTNQWRASEGRAISAPMYGHV